MLFTAITDDGTVIDSETSEKLFLLPAIVNSTSLTPPSFETVKNISHKTIIEDIEKRAYDLFEKEADKLDSWAEDLKLSLEKDLKDLDKQIRETRKQSSMEKRYAEKLEIQKLLRNLQKQRSQKRQALFAEEDRIDHQRDEMISSHTRSRNPKTSDLSIFQIRFKII